MTHFRNRFRTGGLRGCAHRHRGWKRGTSLLEARPAEHRTTLRRLKRDRGFGGALRTNCPGFCTHAVAGSGHALNLALFAPLWIILELLIVKEQLFASSKDKVVTTIRTLQYLVDEIHYASPRACLGIFQYSVDKSLVWHRVTKQLDSSVFDKFPHTLLEREWEGKWCLTYLFHNFADECGIDGPPVLHNRWATDCRVSPALFLPFYDSACAPALLLRDGARRVSGKTSDVSLL